MSNEPVRRRSAWPFAPLARAEAAEWLDQGRGSAVDVATNLAEMARINRRLGGLSALTRHLYPRLRAACASAAGPITVLDIGAGAADAPLAVIAWARANAHNVRLCALDHAARNLAVARRHTAGVSGLSLLAADAMGLPFAPRSVDFVISTQFLHHLSPRALVDMLRAAFSIARRAVIMSDLVRGVLPLAAFALVQPFVARHPLTRHDGALSVRRAYTPVELRALAVAAGLPAPRVYTGWPWRLTLVAEHNAGTGDTHAA